MASPAKAGYLSGPAGLGGKIYGITSLRTDGSSLKTVNLFPTVKNCITFETSKLNIRLQSTVSLPIQATSTDYSKMSSKSAAATNSSLVLNAPTKKVQDYK